MHLPRPITVRLNDHNINAEFEAILKSYQKYNHDTDNTYRATETANHWGFIHDATSHWVKEINTVFLRTVDDKDNIFKVPFDMTQVPGSLTGEVLCEEIISQISQVKTVKNNAASAICEALLSSSDDDTHENQIEDYCRQLKQAADEIDFEKTDQLRALIQEKQKQRQQASDLTPRITKKTIIPKPPYYFKIATIEGIDHSTSTIHLNIAPSNVPTSICGVTCATNLQSMSTSS